ncbi:hypothetical protein [Streptomyces shenzhenensis]|uniref:Uncharacterized protein n=1 Tax=Streptomyces shenzhenensis TaxID=943815 RepID=A0A3M0I7R8_9ACTN|nr:hypothetical protein [Streptomyces shenzhenensis]RMB85601.1 hypothetical protein CTZ28_12475 [Streptomyces shenzhenensis]
MTGRRRRRAPPEKDETEYVPGTLLDWSDRDLHWSSRELPCRYCGFPTHLRDSKRKPAHKVCAEDALAIQAAEAAAAYRARGHLH